MPLSFDYPLDVKRELISSIKPYFGLSYPDPDYANKINVSMEWPQQPAHYPAIFITLTEGPLRNMGVGHIENDTDDLGNPIQFKHYMFEGNVNFNVLALTPLERDRIAGGLINLLAFNDVVPEFEGFLEEVSDDDYVSLILNTETITPQGENTAPVPWGNADELIFGKTYSVSIHGEFFSNIKTGQLIEIGSVNVWPYRPGELPHWTP